jgi:hypothetical protein
MSNTQISEVVNTSTASRMIGLAAGTLENLRISGGGPRFIKHGNKVVYDPADIRDWLEGRKLSSTSERVAA